MANLVTLLEQKAKSFEHTAFKTAQILEETSDHNTKLILELQGYRDHIE